MDRALDHVQQPGGAGVVADRGEVDDHGDVLVAVPDVAPHVLDTNHSDTVEALLIVDQGPPAFGQDSVVCSVPGDPEPFGDPGDGEMLDHCPFYRPPQSGAGQLPDSDPQAVCALGGHTIIARSSTAYTPDGGRRYENVWHLEGGGDVSLTTTRDSLRDGHVDLGTIRASRT